VAEYLAENFGVLSFLRSFIAALAGRRVDELYAGLVFSRLFFGPLRFHLFAILIPHFVFRVSLLGVWLVAPVNTARLAGVDSEDAAVVDADAVEGSLTRTPFAGAETEEGLSRLQGGFSFCSFCSVLSGG
jgi:hypothetical protein